MKRIPYVLLATGIFWAACKKNDNPSKQLTNPPPQHEYLTKIDFTTIQDSALFLYQQDTVLRAFVEEYSNNGAPVIEALYPVISGGLMTAITVGTDTSEANVAVLFSFTFNGNNQVLTSVYHDPVSPYYDSLLYNSSGQLTYVYHFAGVPGSGAGYTAVDSLTWDANGDVVGLITGDSLHNIASTFSYSAVFTYDNEVNPVLRTGGSWVVSFDSENYYQYISTHNITGATINHLDVNDLTSIMEYQTYTYTYDTAGNPLTLVYTDSENGVTATENEAFYYVLK